jgi:hypothetical protein
MAGLYVREMLARRLIRRVLVVPPAGLVGNWETELGKLFGLSFRIVGGWSRGGEFRHWPPRRVRRRAVRPRYGESGRVPLANFANKDCTGRKFWAGEARWAGDLARPEAVGRRG